MPKAYPPFYLIYLTAFSICDLFLLEIMTLAPYFANLIAIPKPIPVEDAVIIATFPLN
jgi:hypothetical protein